MAGLGTPTLAASSSPWLPRPSAPLPPPLIATPANHGRFARRLMNCAAGAAVGYTATCGVKQNRLYQGRSTSSGRVQLRAKESAVAVAVRRCNLPTTFAKLIEEICGDVLHSSSAALLLLDPSGQCCWLEDAISESNVAAVWIDSVPASSVDCVVITHYLPDFNVSSEKLVETLQGVSKVLRPQGQLMLLSSLPPVGSPVWSVLNLPQLDFHVMICDATDGMDLPGELWMYICTSTSDNKTATEKPQQLAVPSAVRLLLEAAPSLSQEQLTVWTRNPAEAIFVYNEIFTNGCYQQVSRQMRTLSKKEELIIVDAGMNIGMFVLFVSRLAARECPGQRLHVVCFEPAPEAYAMAVQSLKEAGIYVVDHGTQLSSTMSTDSLVAVHAFNMALSSTSIHSDVREVLRFYPNSSINSAFVRHKPEMLWYEGEAPECVDIEVPCCQLSEALAACVPVDVPLFLKIDVEGAELEVLAGLTEEDWNRVEGFAVEAVGELQAEQVERAFMRSGFDGSRGSLVSTRQPPGYCGTREITDVFMITWSGAP